MSWLTLNPLEHAVLAAVDRLTRDTSDDTTSSAIRVAFHDADEQVPSDFQLGPAITRLREEGYLTPTTYIRGDGDAVHVALTDRGRETARKQESNTTIVAAEQDFDYDICLSFAGEDREYVDAVAERLRDNGIPVFYDQDATVELWGKDLYEHLHNVYSKASRYCVLFASEAYARKMWTSHERKSAQERALQEKNEYILPARFDDTEIPGLRETIGYVDLRKTSPDELAKLIIEKLKRDGHKNISPHESANKQPVLPTGIKAGHGIRAGSTIEADGPIEAGHGIEADGHIRSSTPASSLRFPPTGESRSHLKALGLVNALQGHFRIRTYASPLDHNAKGCVFRVVVAPDCKPAVDQLKSPIKAALKKALNGSSLESWGRESSGLLRSEPPPEWTIAVPSSGVVSTFERDWGTSVTQGSLLSGRATLALPVGYQSGSRPVLVLDVIERAADSDASKRRILLSLSELHRFLHMLGKTAVDEIGAVVFPHVCDEQTPSLQGPNYEIQFGDRSLDTAVVIPSSFERPANAVSNPWAEINTPEGIDSRDVGTRDTVIRGGLDQILNSNEYHEFEDYIAKLPPPPEL